MENIVNLEDRRKKPVKLPDNATEIMDEFVAVYAHMAMDKMPTGEVLDRALVSIENEIRSMSFEDAMEKINNEFPELVCKFRQDMSV